MMCEDFERLQAVNRAYHKARRDIISLRAENERLDAELLSEFPEVTAVCRSVVQRGALRTLEVVSKLSDY